MLPDGRACAGVDQGSDGRVAAELVDVAAAGGADAADGDAEPDADLGVGHGRVLKQQGDQLLAGGRQCGERLAQRGVALGGEQVLVGGPGLVIGHGLDIGHVSGWRRFLRGAQDLKALSAGHGDEPAWEGGRVADLVQVADQLQPDLLAHVLGVGVGQPVFAADRPDQRAELLDQGIPGVLIARCGAGHEVNDDRVVAHRVTACPGRCRRAAVGGPPGAAPRRGVRHRCRWPWPRPSGPGCWVPVPS